jgi:Holliday junction resolvase RusA-like endonuclease
MLKFVLDCLNRCGAWNDDSQVIALKAEKFWAIDDKPGTHIDIEME